MLAKTNYSDRVKSFVNLMSLAGLLRLVLHYSKLEDFGGSTSSLDSRIFILLTTKKRCFLEMIFAFWSFSISKLAVSRVRPARVAIKRCVRGACMTIWLFFPFLPKRLASIIKIAAILESAFPSKSVCVVAIDASRPIIVRLFNL